MTTIACDGKSMAGDGRACRNDLITNEKCVKVFRLKDGSLLGGAGNKPELQQFQEWLEAGGKRPRTKDISVLLLKPDGTLLYYADEYEPVETDAPNAVGSGQELALGAMEHGATAFEAVQIAARRDCGTGGKLTVLYLVEPQVRAVA